MRLLRRFIASAPHDEREHSGDLGRRGSGGSTWSTKPTLRRKRLDLRIGRSSLRIGGRGPRARPRSARLGAAAAQSVELAAPLGPVRKSVALSMVSDVELLGAGGMGAVWTAAHTATGRRVALKVILPDRAVHQGALGPLSARGRRRGQDRVAVRDAGRLETPAPTRRARQFLVMEDVDGETSRSGSGATRHRRRTRLIAQSARWARSRTARASSTATSSLRTSSCPARAA